mmetsp:Transcript_23201/g.37357  ORF Transcript_23201/g.37357 Transcript_23201/m.37357 type:complete len:111 (+) Transcript_23201:451-783(+)
MVAFRRARLRDAIPFSTTGPVESKDSVANMGGCHRDTKVVAALREQSGKGRTEKGKIPEIRLRAGSLVSAIKEKKEKNENKKAELRRGRKKRLQSLIVPSWRKSQKNKKK